MLSADLTFLRKNKAFLSGMFMISESDPYYKGTFLKECVATGSFPTQSVTQSAKEEPLCSKLARRTSIPAFLCLHIIPSIQANRLASVGTARQRHVDLVVASQLHFNFGSWMLIFLTDLNFSLQIFLKSLSFSYICVWLDYSWNQSLAKFHTTTGWATVQSHGRRRLLPYYLAGDAVIKRGWRKHVSTAFPAYHFPRDYSAVSEHGEPEWSSLHPDYCDCSSVQTGFLFSHVISRGPASNLMCQMWPRTSDLLASVD